MLTYKYVEITGGNPKTKSLKPKTIHIKVPNSLSHEDISTHPEVTEQLIAPYEIAEIPNDPPTDRQLEYAKDLGIRIPKNACKEDVSALISRSVDNDDSVPNPELIDFATQHHLMFSSYIGKKALYDLVFRELPLEDKIAFFCFSIYRYLCEDRTANLEKSRHKQLFYLFAAEYSANEKFVEKMLEYHGRDLRYFGTLKVKTENGSFITTGGDTKNYAYKAAKTYLSKYFEVPSGNSKTIIGERDSKGAGTEAEKLSLKSCSGMAGGCVVMLLALYGLIYLIASILL